MSGKYSCQSSHDKEHLRPSIVPVNPYVSREFSKNLTQVVADLANEYSSSFAVIIYTEVVLHLSLKTAPITQRFRHI